MMKIVEHVYFQRRIEKSLHKFYRFVDFCVFKYGHFFELPCEIQNDTNCKKLLVCAFIYLQKGLSTVTEALLLSWKKHFCT